MISNACTRAIESTIERKEEIDGVDRPRESSNSKMRGRKRRTLMEKENWIRQVSRHNLKSSGRISIPVVREITITTESCIDGGNRGESQLGISRIKSRVVLLAVRTGAAFIGRRQSVPVYRDKIYVARAAHLLPFAARPPFIMHLAAATISVKR